MDMNKNTTNTSTMNETFEKGVDKGLNIFQKIELDAKKVTILVTAGTALYLLGRHKGRRDGYIDGYRHGYRDVLAVGSAVGKKFISEE